MLIIYILRYVFTGLVFNFIHDITISYMDREDLRFNILERILFFIMWPIFATMLIYSFIKTIIYGQDED